MIIEAINRPSTYPYHIGQIVFIDKAYWGLAISIYNSRLISKVQC